ncbi:MAG: HAD family phosphatase [Candidatus Latescibacteria bacterium]|nr:HAD family phosphatase [Candidatus Latescibacterota bacterium]
MPSNDLFSGRSDLNYRLIAIDIDGTLLTSDRVVTQRTDHAINSAIENGVYVYLCTGRSLNSGAEIAGGVHGNTGLVFHSGALILRHLNGPVLRAINLPLEPARELITFFKAEGHDPLVYDPVPESRQFLFEAERSPNEWRRRYIEGSKARALEVPDLDIAVTKDPAQVGVAGSGEEMERLQTHLSVTWPDVGTILSQSTLVSDYWFLEAVPREVSKSQALAFLGQMYGIDSSEMIAIGDNYNDLDMIEFAGLGVAMKNAPSDIQRAADFVAPTNDDEGVACIIERFLL